MKLFRRKKKKSKNGDAASEFTESEKEVRFTTAPIREKPKPRSYREILAEQPTKAQSKPPQPPPKRSWLTKTKFFQDMCDNVFNIMDTDGSGEVDEKELYSGLLLVHLKLGTYAGPAACRPISRERCHEMFVKFDKDKGGSLDRQEFGNVMGVLFGNVLFRVVLQYSLTLMIVPFLANTVVDGVVALTAWFWHFLSTLDEHSSAAHQVELLLELIRDGICDFYRSITPGLLQSLGDGFVNLLAKVPESVWKSLPLTLTSAVLGLLIVPRSIMKMDDFFQHLADKKAKSLDNHHVSEQVRNF